MKIWYPSRLVMGTQHLKLSRLSVKKGSGWLIGITRTNNEKSTLLKQGHYSVMKQIRKQAVGKIETASSKKL